MRKLTYSKPETELEFLSLESNACAGASGNNDSFTPISGSWD